jgi:nitrite reductase/ring-hydroxylating ferredoxin subunit
VGPEVELGAHEARLVDIGDDPRGIRQQAIVIRDAGGVPHAYLNRCRHLPIPLGVGTGDVLSDDERYLICRTHGALYRRGDGYCVEGPCAGTSLAELVLERDEHGILWIVSG